MRRGEIDGGGDKVLLEGISEYTDVGNASETVSAVIAAGRADSTEWSMRLAVIGP